MKILMRHQLKQLNATENGYNHIIPPHFKIHSYTSIFVFIFVLCVKNTYLLASKYFLFQFLVILDRNFQISLIKNFLIFKMKGTSYRTKSCFNYLNILLHSYNNIFYFKWKQETILLCISLTEWHRWFVANTVANIVSAIYPLIE